MKTIRASERLNGQAFRGLRFDPKKLKGHVKVNLRDVYTGKTKTIEGDNVVTNALADILASDYLGCLNYGAMMPLYSKWFGGLLCYEDAFATTVIDGVTVPDPSDYYPQGDDVNKLIAHAGDVAPATAEIVNEDLKRGSPVYVSTTENSVKFIWDFTTRQGNGIISALALTHKDTGNAGIGVNSSAFQAFDPFENLSSSDLTASEYAVVSPQNLFGQYDDNHGFWFAIGEEGEYTTESNHTKFETTKLTVYIKRLPFAKTGLFETLQVRTDYAKKFTVTLGFNLYIQPCYYFDYTNKYLWIFSNSTGINGTYSTTTVNYAVIDCTNETVLTSGTITGTDLAPIPFQPKHEGMSYSTNIPINYNIVCDGTNVWIPTVRGSVDWSDLRWSMNVDGLKKIKISDSTLIDTIAYNQELGRAQGASVKCGGLIIATGGQYNDSGSRCVVTNNGVGYKCVANYPAVGLNAGNLATLCEPYKPINFLTGVGTHSGLTRARYVLASKLVHTTKFNLPASVEKTATQAMTVEYTITET